MLLTFSLILTLSSPELIEGPLETSGVPKQDFLDTRGTTRRDPPLSQGGGHRPLVQDAELFRGSNLTDEGGRKQSLAVGLPIISNAGIGDTDKIIESDAVGVILRDFHRGGLSLRPR